MEGRAAEQQARLRALPAVHELLNDSRCRGWLHRHPRAVVVRAVQRALAAERRAILALPAGVPPALDRERLLGMIAAELDAQVRPNLVRVINATGVILHTNLGRAPLAADALAAIRETAAGYSNLEYDLPSGERGSRQAHVEGLLTELTGAEAAVVVNNNAGAVLLALSSLAAGREVVVSRGELVEIGGAFRIPDVMRRSGAVLREVGTTNRTHLRDYEEPIGEQTALLLKVHTSNFQVVGFTAEVPVEELVTLGQRRGLPVMVDLGSGCLIDLSRYGLSPEPTVQAQIRAGVDLVTFSGDKLLGGPQAGVVLGRRALVRKLRENPLHRALRMDKLTLAGLEATLRLYQDETRAVEVIPVLRMLLTPESALRRRARRVATMARAALGERCEVRVQAEHSQVGGGALPLLALPTRVVALRPRGESAAKLEERLREARPPVIARIREESLLLDVRTIADDELPLLRQALRALSLSW
ncbi:MAG: L-seryl-tRNA(Sec) selenium transferase [Deltaproteobacteria bacterium]|nr:L-seryl-tRNA(Sec) selenium transferase [Deltaproteobacteria bacterium]